MIVTFNRIIGNTFFGWTDDQENKHKWKPILLKLWNVCSVLIVTGSLLTFMNFGFVDISDKDRSANNNNITSQETLSTKFNLPSFLYMVTVINFSGQTIVISLYLLLIGPKLMSLLAEEKTYDLDIDPRSEYRTAKWIIIVQVCAGIAPIIGNLVTTIIFHTYSLVIILLFFNDFPSIIFVTTFLVLIAYKSYTVRHVLKKIEDDNVNIVVMYKMLCNIDRSICKMDQYVSIYILFALLSNTLFCVSVFSQLALNHEIRTLETIINIYLGLSPLSLLCYLCNVIPASFSNLISKVEYDLNDSINGYDSESRQILIQMREMNTRIGFTGFGFFRVNGNTFLSCLALIISYSVIIIQTGSQEESNQTHLIKNFTCLCSRNN